MSFRATLFKVDGKGGWTFAPVPPEHAPELAGSWGRTPCVATVDGQTWATSVWRDKAGDWVLPVPARIRRGKGHGDEVVISLAPDPDRAPA